MFLSLWASQYPGGQNDCPLCVRVGDQGLGTIRDLRCSLNRQTNTSIIQKEKSGGGVWNKSDCTLKNARTIKRSSTDDDLVSKDAA
jgi:hypothetical protein